MKKATSAKFPNSIQLFKFCQKIMSQNRGVKIRDQEVGAILDFNPSDCSHWKRGEKSVRSVFSLAKLADVMQIEPTLVHDVASGAATLDEAYFEYVEMRTFSEAKKKLTEMDAAEVAAAAARIESFVAKIHEQTGFTTPPLYVPEVTRFFSFVSTQAVDMMDKLSRILRIRPGVYCIQYKKGDLKPQTRMSIVKDLARIVLEGERARFPELGPANSELFAFENLVFTANLLAPKSLMQVEMSKLDTRKNFVSELAALFWIPKSIVGLQLQDMVRASDGRVTTNIAPKSLDIAI